MRNKEDDGEEKRITCISEDEDDDNHHHGSSALAWLKEWAESFPDIISGEGEKEMKREREREQEKAVSRMKKKTKDESHHPFHLHLHHEKLLFRQKQHCGFVFPEFSFRVKWTRMNFPPSHWIYFFNLSPSHLPSSSYSSSFSLSLSLLHLLYKLWILRIFRLFICSIFHGHGNNFLFMMNFLFFLPLNLLVSSIHFWRQLITWRKEDEEN